MRTMENMEMDTQFDMIDALKTMDVMFPTGKNDIFTRALVMMYKVNQLMGWEHTSDVDELFERIEADDPEFLKEYMNMIENAFGISV